MAQQTINNGETGLSVRTKLNTMFGELYGGTLAVQFSADGVSSWHDTFAGSGVDEYMRFSDDLESSWSDAIPLGSGSASGTTDTTVFEISLPSDTTVAGRVSGAVSGTDYPSGWTIAAGSNPVDLDITHNLSRRVANVTVFAVTGDEERQLFNGANYTGILTPDSDSLRIESLATITKQIKIYMVFV